MFIYINYIDTSKYWYLYQCKLNSDIGLQNNTRCYFFFQLQTRKYWRSSWIKKLHSLKVIYASLKVKLCLEVLLLVLNHIYKRLKLSIRTAIVIVTECFYSWKSSQHFTREGQEIFVDYCGLMMWGGIQVSRNSRSFTREVISILKLKSVEIPYEVKLWCILSGDRALEWFAWDWILVLFHFLMKGLVIWLLEIF